MDVEVEVEAGAEILEDPAVEADLVVEEVEGMVAVEEVLEEVLEAVALGTV